MSNLIAIQKPISPIWARNIASILILSSIQVSDTNYLKRLPTHIYLQFSRRDVNNWQDAKGLISAIVSTIGGVAGITIFPGNPYTGTIGSGLGKFLTEAVFYNIIKIHEKHGEKGLTLLIRTWELFAFPITRSGVGNYPEYLITGQENYSAFHNPFRIVIIGNELLGFFSPVEVIGNANAIKGISIGSKDIVTAHVGTVGTGFLSGSETI